jgi:hypothetical protein
MAINKVARRFQPDHVIFALEGRSWRKDFYAPYKKDRAAARAALTEIEAEEDRLFWEMYVVFTEYLRTRTNCSVIRHPTAEADDIIARWIALHPADSHVIVSSDTDFVQLLAPNVTQFNGITDELLTIEGIFNERLEPVLDKKTNMPKTTPDPAWLLFEKCMRGDVSDNVFSAYPGVREHSTRNRIGLREAFADKNKRGYAWNNLMLQRWTDHDGNEHRVLDDYERNRVLIDLTAQPQDIKQAVDSAIREQISRQDCGQVGSHFLKFCGRYELTRCSDSAEQFGRWLNQSYSGTLIEEIVA